MVARKDGDDKSIPRHRATPHGKNRKAGNAALDHGTPRVHGSRNEGLSMLTAYRLTEKGLEEAAPQDGAEIPPSTAWIDLHQPTVGEDRVAERFLGAEIPSREETEEIEFSSRFYAEDGAVFMTASLLTGVDMGKPALAPFTIIVAADRIATVRYDDLRAVRQFVSRASKAGNGYTTTATIFVGLIEAIVDRTADVLERISKDVDGINRGVFAREADLTRKNVQSGRALETLISAIGVQGDLAAKARESLASLERLVQYAGLALPGAHSKGANRARLKLAGRDIKSLEDHVDFLSNKITFLLDATLGLISVEQNEVIRILTVGATVFFPPTLIGTIYGMNFDDMPELHWTFGYPLVIIIMLASAVLPFFYFRRRGWL
jgi:magnesium transporter